MRIFNRPGMLLNPLMVQNPAGLPAAFGATLADAATNTCALADELGAIAYALCEGGDAERGEQLFNDLESGPLSKRRKRIAACLESVTEDVLKRAFVHARRFFLPIERAPKNKRPRRDDAEVAQALLDCTTLTDAARELGYSKGRLSLRIKRASDESALAVFKDSFPKYGRRHSDEQIDKVLRRCSTLTEAAAELGYTVAALSLRISRASDASKLKHHSGTF